MGQASQGFPSLRLWLQSTSLLAVVAGYSVLLLIHQHVAAWQRDSAYRQTSEQVLAGLGRQASTPEALNRLLGSSQPLPGVRVLLVNTSLDRSSDALNLIRRGRSRWLMGQQPLDLVDGSRVVVRVEQDVTASMQQEQLGFWLLVMAAGISSLITSALLRLVLRRGLVKPLHDFSQDLASFKAPPNPADVLAVKQQASELQPIAEAFNALQSRLVESWNRERAFVDGVAHELRTPITLISGHAQRLLRAEADLTNQPRALHLIHHEAERMRTLVSDLLDLARRDSGRLSLNRRPIVVEDALIELVERLEPKAQGRLRLELKDTQTDDSPWVSADPDRLQQCLTALVDNALLYSSGPVGLSWSVDDTSQVLLHVCDQGPGVLPEEREQIFERFVRGDAALRSPHRGSGIGLSVVKLLMEAMGGGVQVVPATQGGADFQLRLPAFRPAAHRASA